METQVTTTQKNNIVSSTNSQSAGEILSSDIILPKILLMQGLSQFVSDEKASMGDMIRNSTLEKVGDAKKPLRIIPLAFKNLWMLTEDAKGDGKNYEFRGYEDRNYTNEQQDWEFQKDGTNWKRTKVMQLFAILPSDIAAQKSELDRVSSGDELPDLNKMVLPVVINLKTTSFKTAARPISTHFAKIQDLAQTLGREIPPYTNVIELACVKEKNEKGTFYVYHATAKEKVNDEEKRVAAQWFTRLKSMQNIRIDESGEVESSTAATEVPF